MDFQTMMPQLLTLHDVTQPKEPTKFILRRNFNEKNIANFQLNLSYEHWGEIFMETDVNLMFNKFLNVYLRCYNLSFPVEKKCIHTNTQNKWITKGIIVSCKKKKKKRTLLIIYI
jgi:hypothetical protein